MVKLTAYIDTHLPTRLVENIICISGSFSEINCPLGEASMAFWLTPNSPNTSSSVLTPCVPAVRLIHDMANVASKVFMRALEGKVPA